MCCGVQTKDTRIFSTFVYCLLVLRTVRRAEEVLFVPHLSVTIGVLFALASLGVLIYFIHHVSVSIQADEVVARVGRELFEGIDRLFPDQVGEERSPPANEPHDAAIPGTFDTQARPVRADGDRPEDRAALRRHAEMIARGAREGLPEEEDRREAEDRYEAVIRSLGDSSELGR